MLRFVLASHGKMAEGMRDSIHLILGKSVDICTICAYTRGPDDVIKEIKQMFETFAKEDKVIVMTDLFGGSVSTAFAGMLAERNFWLVAGVSLGLVAELLLIKEDDNIEESIEEALENNRKLMCFCNPLLQGMADWRQRV